jgi:hypothetical protein
MKKKLVFVLVMLTLSVLVTATAPRDAMAACSGDDCGCPDEFACINGCPPPGDPNRQPCVLDCKHETHCCALICCGASPWQC